MKNLRWMIVAAVLFGITLLLQGWTRFSDLTHQREWQAETVETAEGELSGIRVAVREAQAAVVDSKPDRGLLFVRIDLQGAAADIRSWVNCRVSLRASDGRIWMPLTGPEVQGAIQILASDAKDNGRCDLSRVRDQESTVFDQVYRIPTAALEDLTLYVSGYGTRPESLSFVLKPEVRTFKTQ